MSRRILMAFAAAWLPYCAASMAAESYPSKPIRIVAAGGSTDILARNIAQRLNEAMRNPVIVENRPGGGAVVGAEHVAKSPADGYKLLMGTNTTHAVAPHLYAKLPYNALRDFIPISAEEAEELDV